MARPVAAPGAAAAIPLAYARPVPRLASPIALPISRLRALIELLGVVPAAAGGLAAGWFFTDLTGLDDERWFHVGGSIGMGAGAVVAVLLMMGLARHRPATIGLTGHRLALNVALALAALVGFYIFSFALGLMLLMLAPEFLLQQPQSVDAIETTFPPMPFAGIVALMAFVALWEETVFRGFLLTRLHVLVRRWWLVVPVGSVAFAAGHIYQGPLAVVMTGVLGLILGSLFIWRKSLIPGIVFHLLHNTLALQMVQWMSAHAP